MADRRHVDGEGNVWASRYESEVYDQLRLLGCDVRRCSPEEGDSFDYTSKVVRGQCLECESDRVVQRRTYTPDLRLYGAPGLGRGPVGGIIIEAKGYWPAPKRNLLRSVYKGEQDTPLVFVFQADRWVTKGKSKYTDYVARYMPTWGSVVWNNIPRLLPGEKRGGKKGSQEFPLEQVFAFFGD